MIPMVTAQCTVHRLSGGGEGVQGVLCLPAPILEFLPASPLFVKTKQDGFASYPFVSSDEGCFFFSTYRVTV